MCKGQVDSQCLSGALFGSCVLHESHCCLWLVAWVVPGHSHIAGDSRAHRAEYSLVSPVKAHYSLFQASSDDCSVGGRPNPDLLLPCCERGSAHRVVQTNTHALTSNRDATVITADPTFTTASRVAPEYTKNTEGPDTVVAAAMHVGTYIEV